MARSDLLSVVWVRGKVGLVTGGSGGIGSAVVDLLFAAGAKVLSVDLPDRSEPGGDAVRLPCDLTQPPQVHALITRAGKDNGRLDIVVHCAGITRDSVLLQMEESALSEVLSLNLD